MMDLKACQAAGSTLGSKLSFIMHILGRQGVKMCPHASDAAKQKVQAQCLAGQMAEDPVTPNANKTGKKCLQPSMSVEPNLNAIFPAVQLILMHCLAHHPQVPLVQSEIHNPCNRCGNEFHFASPLDKRMPKVTEPEALRIWRLLL
jgi:hypothetical protein